MPIDFGEEVGLFAVRDQGGFPLSSRSANPLTGQRILVAEDESFIALELERMLESFGCEVVGPVSSVREVLQHAIQGDCDGALLDVNLRGQQIFEILPKLENLGLRLVIASGYNDVTLFPTAFRQVPRIAKPFDERELRRICENVFAKSPSRSQVS
jgi:DNA-binding NtrC family response regulator